MFYGVWFLIILKSPLANVFGFQADILFSQQCHKAKNLVPEAGGQATRTGEAVLEIQVCFLPIS